MMLLLRTQQFFLLYTAVFSSATFHLGSRDEDATIRRRDIVERIPDFSDDTLDEDHSFPPQDGDGFSIDNPFKPPAPRDRSTSFEIDTDGSTFFGKENPFLDNSASFAEEESLRRELDGFATVGGKILSHNYPVSWTT